MSGKTFVERVQKNIIIYSVLGIFLIGLIVSLVSLIPLYKSLRSNAENNLTYVLHEKKMRVEAYLSRIEDVAFQITSRTRIRDMLELYNSGELSLDKLANFTGPKLIDAMKLSKDSKGITRLDKDGNPVVQVGVPVPEELRPIPAENSKEALLHGPFVLKGGEPGIVVSAPIINRQSVRVGTDVVLFDVSYLQSIMEDYSGLGETGETILGISQDNTAQLFFPLRNTKTVPEPVAKDSPLGAGIEKALHKETGILVFDTDTIAYSPVLGTEWGIIVRMNEGELNRSINRHLLLLVFIIITLVTLVTFAVVLLIRPLTDALKKELIKRKENEEKVKSSLAEKEILLREIHHRVKNNMQIISSILKLQSGYVSDEQSLAILRESKSRVDVMATIHEKLYQSENLEKINFTEYISGLLNTLLISYGVNTNMIKTEIEAEGIYFNINTAIPCGLILNELVSNSLKHAFPDGRSGHIRVALHPIGEDKFSLLVSDDGIGFPKDLDFEATDTLGLKLVTALTSQLDGTIELKRNGGTAFSILFHKLKYRKKS